MNKRDFLRTSAGTALGVLLGDSLWARFADLPAGALAQEEATRHGLERVSVDCSQFGGPGLQAGTYGTG